MEMRCSGVIRKSSAMSAASASLKFVKICTVLSIEQLYRIFWGFRRSLTDLEVRAHSNNLKVAPQPSNSAE